MSNSEQFVACGVRYRGSDLLRCQRVEGHTTPHCRDISDSETMYWDDEEAE